MALNSRYLSIHGTFIDETEYLHYLQLLLDWASIVCLIIHGTFTCNVEHRRYLYSQQWVFMVGSMFILSVRGTQNLLDTKYSLYIYSAVSIHVTFIQGAQQVKYIYALIRVHIYAVTHTYTHARARARTHTCTHNNCWSIDSVHKSTCSCEMSLLARVDERKKRKDGKVTRSMWHGRDASSLHLGWLRDQVWCRLILICI